jgi:long-chain acyl-CoA synthetase
MARVRSRARRSWKLANKLVYSKLREAFGGNGRGCSSPAARRWVWTPQNWFLDVNIRIFEGYGLTETSPVISRNTFDAYRIGTVGPDHTEH